MKKFICEYYAREEVIEAMKNVRTFDDYEEVEENYTRDEAFAAFVIAKGLEDTLGERLMEIFIDYSHYVDVISENTEEE